jgi:hypothetical protein
MKRSIFSAYNLAIAGAMGISFSILGAAPAYAGCPQHPSAQGGAADCSGNHAGQSAAQTAQRDQVVVTQQVVRKSVQDFDPLCDKDVADEKKARCAEKQARLKAEADQQKFEEKKAKIEARRDERLKKIGEDRARIYNEYLAERRKIDSKFDPLQDELAIRLASGKDDPCMTDKQYCDTLKKARKVDRKRSKAEDDLVNDYAKKMSKLSEKERDAREDADKDIAEAEANIGKKGFWAKVATPFKWLGARGKDVFYDAPKWTLKKIGGVLCRCDDNGCTPISQEEEEYYRLRAKAALDRMSAGEVNVSTSKCLEQSNSECQKLMSESNRMGASVSTSGMAVAKQPSFEARTYQGTGAGFLGGAIDGMGVAPVQGAAQSAGSAH